MTYKGKTIEEWAELAEALSAENLELTRLSADGIYKQTTDGQNVIIHAVLHSGSLMVSAPVATHVNVENCSINHTGPGPAICLEVPPGPPPVFSNSVVAKRK